VIHLQCYGFPDLVPGCLSRGSIVSHDVAHLQQARPASAVPSQHVVPAELDPVEMRKFSHPISFPLPHQCENAIRVNRKGSGMWRLMHDIFRERENDYATLSWDDDGCTVGYGGSIARGNVAYAEERVCRGTLGAITVDNLRVPQGATCSLVGTYIKGTVKVEGSATLGCPWRAGHRQC
jgi:hypothetical protein